MTPQVLLTGGAGQVGLELRRLAPAGVHLVAPTRQELDIADPDTVQAFMRMRPWAAVINAAAYTAVDAAETEVVAAWRANALGPAVLAQEAARAGIPIVHYSTDYVFDGAKRTPYLEDDPVGPMGVYGASKEGGEQAVRTAAARHVILRTAWVVSPHGRNFVKTMLKLGAERPVLRVVSDQVGSPTSATDIALATLAILERHLADDTAPCGTFHLVNAGEASWHEFARAIFELAPAVAPRLEAIGTADYPTPARRPANSRLATTKLEQQFGLRPRAWREAIGDVVEAILGAGEV